MCIHSDDNDWWLLTMVNVCKFLPLIVDQSMNHGWPWFTKAWWVNNGVVNHPVFTWCFTWCLHDLYMVLTWCLYMVFTWCLQPLVATMVNTMVRGSSWCSNVSPLQVRGRGPPWSRPPEQVPWHFFPCREKRSHWVRLSCDRWWLDEMHTRIWYVCIYVYVYIWIYMFCVCWLHLSTLLVDNARWLLHSNCWVMLAGLVENHQKKTIHYDVFRWDPARVGHGLLDVPFSNPQLFLFAVGNITYLPT